MKRIIPFAHQLIKEIVTPHDVVIDATCGNGNDTLFLSGLIQHPGHVYAFDIQEQAIETTKELLLSNQIDHVTCIHDSHANIDHHIKGELKNKIAAAIFNLGYLPHSDKKIITTPKSTITAIEKLLDFIKQGGRIVIVVYYGHDGGTTEKNELLKFAIELDRKLYSVIQYGFINKKNAPPFIIAIEKC